MEEAGYDPLIVTLEIDAENSAHLDALRQEHFPPERNYLRAHLTLFHKLPGSEREQVAADLRAEAERVDPFALHLAEPTFLGFGVAIRIESEELVQLRRRLAARWAQWLTPQDRQKFRPHVTIQNKVGAERARYLYEQMQQSWTPRRGRGEGVQLWWYRGGPWEEAGSFLFEQANG